MSRAFEELDRRTTSLGELVLRRRLEPTLQIDLFEVKLGDEHLMSSLFTTAEEQLAHLGIAALDASGGDDAAFDVAVGGLGLGHTAAAALDHPAVGRLDVIEALAPVIDWHERVLVPLGPQLTADPRCRFHHADFFARTAGPPPLVPGGPTHYDAILVDIDHTPAHHLHDSHAGFYTADALGALAAHLRPRGVFALWSDDRPDAPFVELLTSVFDDVEAHLVEFRNPLTGGTGIDTVYIGRRRTEPAGS
jgi:spermidine synthase